MHDDKPIKSLLQLAAGILAVVLLTAWGTHIDLAREEEEAPAVRSAFLSGVEQGRQQGRQEALNTVRQAYKQGLAEGAERERAARARGTK